MGSSQILLAELKAGRCSGTSEVRLLRFWEARNVKKGGQLMSIDMLFVDKASTVVQGSISASRQMRFRERLREGCIYNLSGFDVVRSSPNFRICDAPYSIRFNDRTSIEEATSSLTPIPTELFRFVAHPQLLELANTGKQLPDVIGELDAVRSTIADCIPGAKRVMLTLRLESDDKVCVGLFDSMAEAYDTKRNKYGKDPTIVMASNVNPKIVGGRLYLNATSATHLYFDKETEAGKAFFQTLPVNGPEQLESPSKLVHAQKIEPMTLSELNEFIITAESQVIEFLCTAKVTAIEEDEGWSYIGCSKCAKKLVQEISSFTCVLCNKTNAVASLRYRVIMAVSDNTDTAYFMGFDTEMAKLTSMKASDAGQIVGIGLEAQIVEGLPPSLAAIVGKTYTFQLRLKDFNFSSKHKTFTISRIFAERLVAPMPVFENVPANTADALPEPLPPGVPLLGNSSNNPDIPSASEVTSGKRPPSYEVASVGGGSGGKRPHVE